MAAEERYKAIDDPFMVAKFRSLIETIESLMEHMQTRYGSGEIPRDLLGID